MIKKDTANIKNPILPKETIKNGQTKSGIDTM